MNRRGRRFVVALLVVLAAWLPTRAPARDGTERRLGDVLSYALPAAALGGELLRGDGAGAGQFARSFVVTLAATEALKRTTGVERPDHSDDLSFPSGHAARAFAAATFVHRRHGFANAVPLYAVATFVGYTRVQANRHRWADVLGAAVVAALSSRFLVEPRPIPGNGTAGIMLLFAIPVR
jgi:membrane-associated phospholipid phosphatase